MIFALVTTNLGFPSIVRVTDDRTTFEVGIFAGRDTLLDEDNAPAWRWLEDGDEVLWPWSTPKCKYVVHGNELHRVLMDDDLFEYESAEAIDA